MFRIMITKAESEKALEARLTTEVKSRKGIALKYTSQFHRGIPDRIVLLPYRTIAFVEMKSTGKQPTKLQVAAMDMLRKLGFHCYVIDSTEKLDAFLARMDRRIARIDAEVAEQAEKMSPEEINDAVPAARAQAAKRIAVEQAKEKQQ